MSVYKVIIISLAGLHLQKPDEMTAIVQIEVDTPTTTLRPLEVIELRSMVGFARLHISKNLDVLKLKSSLGKKGQTVFTLKNVGNISFTYALQFTGVRTGLYRVSREHYIPPGEETLANVIFQPTSRKLDQYETLLIMSEEPDGRTYELPIVATLTEDPGVTLQSDALLSDRSYMSFGGVAVGKSCKYFVTLGKKKNMCVYGPPTVPNLVE